MMYYFVGDCDECGRKSVPVVYFGEKEYEHRLYTLCIDCVEKAYMWLGEVECGYVELMPGVWY